MARGQGKRSMFFRGSDASMYTPLTEYFFLLAQMIFADRVPINCACSMAHGLLRALPPPGLSGFLSSLRSLPLPASVLLPNGGTVIPAQACAGYPL